MKHKLKIYATHMRSGGLLWYVSCLNPDCGDRWVPLGPPIRPGGPPYFGRTTMDAALAVGIAHQKEQ